jgi:general secretion pathway protein J
MNNGETWRWVFTTPGDKPEVAAPRQEEKQAPAPVLPNVQLHADRS